MGIISAKSGRLYKTRVLRGYNNYQTDYCSRPKQNEWASLKIYMTSQQNLRAAFDTKDRAICAKMIVRLFKYWKLSTSDQLVLLGLRSRSTLSRYRNGKPMSNKRDLIDRVSYLFDIHAQLRLMFPRNRNLVYGWMTAKISDFSNQTPVDIVRRQGVVGLNILHAYLLNNIET